jgi:hypothetical protein
MSAIEIRLPSRLSFGLCLALAVLVSGCGTLSGGQSSASIRQEASDKALKAISESEKPAVGYHVCVRLEAAALDDGSAPPGDIADAASSQCAETLNSYVAKMRSFETWSEFSIHPTQTNDSAVEPRTDEDRDRLVQTVRQYAIYDVLKHRSAGTAVLRSPRRVGGSASVANASTAADSDCAQQDKELARLAKANGYTYQSACK